MPRPCAWSPPPPLSFETLVFDGIGVSSLVVNINIWFAVLCGVFSPKVNVGTWLRADKVNPTLEEIQRFKSRREKKDRG